MPLMKGSDTIAANGSNANVLTGEDFEFLSSPSLVTVSLSQESGVGTLAVDVKADNATLGANLGPNIASAAGRVIQDEDMVIDQEFVPAGSRLKIAVEETAGTETDLYWMVKVEPIPAGLI